MKQNIISITLKLKKKEKNKIILTQKMKYILFIALILGISTFSANENKVWNYLRNQGLTKAGAAGLMGNLKAESGGTPRCSILIEILGSNNADINGDVSSPLSDRCSDRQLLH